MNSNKTPSSSHISDLCDSDFMCGYGLFSQFKLQAERFSAFLKMYKRTTYIKKETVDSVLG